MIHEGNCIVSRHKGYLFFGNRLDNFARFVAIFAPQFLHSTDPFANHCKPLTMTLGTLHNDFVGRQCICLCKKKTLLQCEWRSNP